MEYVISSDPFTLTWNVTDDNIKEYTISVDGTPFAEGSYEEPTANSPPVTKMVSVDLMVDHGTYTITLDVSDYDNLHASFTTTLTAKDPAKPSSPLGPSFVDFLSVTVLAISILVITKKRIHI